MKKLTIFAVLCLSFLMTPSIYRASQHIRGINFMSLNGVKYKLVLEKMFDEEDLPKIKAKLVEVYAPFEIVSVDYNSKSLVISMTQKASFDDVKQAIDKLGLRISKEEIVK